jgi:hypothetical protein
LKITIKYNNFLALTLTLFFVGLAFITPFNESGWQPISLIISVILAIVSSLQLLFLNYRRSKFTLIDSLLLLFIINSFLSIVFNFNNLSNLNLNHLLAHCIVLFFYYYVPKFALNNCKNQSLIKFINYSFVLIALTGIIDYILLVIGINWADYIPSNAAPVDGFFIFQRGRGFFVEPTDFGMALNAFGPILLVWHYRKRNTKLFLFYFTLYLLSILICRSTSAISGLLVGIILSYVIYFISSLLKKNVSFSIYSFKNILFLLIIFFVFTILFGTYIYDVYSEFVYKISFENVSSSQSRLNSWVSIYEQYLLKGNYFFGNGTGYTTGSQGDGGSLNWYLTVLFENGISGIIILLLIFIIVIITLIKKNSFVKYGFLISFFSIVIHLFTQTGFYFPYLWLHLVLPQLNWDIYDLEIDNLN